MIDTGYEKKIRLPVGVGACVISLWNRGLSGWAVGSAEKGDVRLTDSDSAVESFLTGWLHFRLGSFVPYLARPGSLSGKKENVIVSLRDAAVNRLRKLYRKVVGRDVRANNEQYEYPAALRSDALGLSWNNSNRVCC